MWTGDIYSIVYHIFEQLDYSCSIFVDRNLDKNKLFVKEEKDDINFYRNWYKNLGRYILLETVRSQFQCPHCAKHPLQLQLKKEKLIVADYCDNCGIYLGIEDLVSGITFEDTSAGKLAVKAKEVRARNAEYRRAERMEQRMFVEQFFEAMHQKNLKEKERKEKYQARLDDAKKRRARNRKARERYREKLASEGKEVKVKRKVGKREGYSRK